MNIPPPQAHRRSFSALQRAENSSIVGGITVNAAPGSFSALQRAENSSIAAAVRAPRDGRGFSALQRAENSSMSTLARELHSYAQVSVLFSEPKIPQYGYA